MFIYINIYRLRAKKGIMILIPLNVSREKSIISLEKQGKKQSILGILDARQRWSRDKLKFKDLRCLYVDDIDENHTYMSEILKHLGITVSHGNNGKEGLEVYLRSPMLDLIIADLRMPVMSGQQMIMEIRKIERAHSKAHKNHYFEWGTFRI